MRLPEATGVGLLLHTDEGSNLAETFERRREVVTYAYVDDLVETARQYELRMRELSEILRKDLA